MQRYEYQARCSKIMVDFGEGFFEEQGYLFEKSGQYCCDT